MSHLDELRNARESAAPVFHDFLKRAAKSPNTVHAFFEGNDDCSFYTSFLQRFVEHFESYECKSKKAVLDAHTKVMPRISAPSAALFFVDKDLSDLIGEVTVDAVNIYTTDFYAIENYVVTDIVLRRVWTEMFRFSGVTLDFEEYRVIFAKTLSRFHELMLPISAWMIYARRHGWGAIIDNIKMPRIFSLDQLDIRYSDLVEAQGLFQTLNIMCRVTSESTSKQEIESIINHLESLDPKRHVRGKFELWFFVTFINALIPILEAKATELGGSIQVRFPLSDKQAIVLLGPRVHPIPSSLERFLSQNLPQSDCMVS